MSEEEGFERTFTHAMELWFEPEIKRRQEAERRQSRIRCARRR